VTDPTQLHAPPPGRQELEGRQELSADDRRRLRELCERATPGPWTVKKSGNAEWRNLVNVVEGGDGSLIVYGQISDKDAAFVVAAHPGLVLSLLDENDALKINVEGAHAWLDEAAGPDHSDHTPDGLRLRVEGLVKRLDAAEADRDELAGWKADAASRSRVDRLEEENARLCDAVRYSQDAEYAAEVDADAGESLTREELAQAARDNPPPPEIFDTPADLHDTITKLVLELRAAHVKAGVLRADRDGWKAEAEGQDR
jgi:hypothetical protein